MPARTGRRTWIRFNFQQREQIEAQLLSRSPAACPLCATLLEAQPSTRLAAVLPPGCRGVDLACRGCRRFHPRLQAAPRSRYHLALRRLAAAVMRA